jgi:hypothetical protein
MRVLVVSEGEHEQGGALENLLRRLGGREAQFVFDCVQRDDIHAHHGRGPGYIKRALRWLKEAKRREVDALILLVDQDKPEYRRSEQVRQAQEYCHPKVPAFNLPRAMGVAIKMFDAWMLADEKALTEVLGCTIARQRDPESIRDPKGVCARLLANGQNPMAQRDMYAEIARRVDIDILCSRCPKGFRPFAGHVRYMFDPNVATGRLG